MFFNLLTAVWLSASSLQAWGDVQTSKRGPEAIRKDVDIHPSVSPRPEKKEGYESFRRKLLSAGWLPVVDREADKCGSNDVRCSGRPEMISCSGTGMAHCRFEWFKVGGGRLVVVTSGEDRDTVIRDVWNEN